MITRKRGAGRFAAIAGVALATTGLLGGCAAGASQSSNDGKTLNAIFLPAPWGTVVKEQLAPEYEKETGVKVNVELIARDAIHEKMATLFAGQDSSYDIFNLDYN